MCRLLTAAVVLGLIGPVAASLPAHYRRLRRM